MTEKEIKEQLGRSVRMIVFTAYEKLSIQRIPVKETLDWAETTIIELYTKLQSEQASSLAEVPAPENIRTEFRLTREEILNIAAVSRYYVGKSETEQFVDCVEKIFTEQLSKVQPMIERIKIRIFNQTIKAMEHRVEQAREEERERIFTELENKVLIYDEKQPYILATGFQSALNYKALKSKQVEEKKE
jgi:predicted lipase